MKKINSNRYGHRIIGLAALFLIIFPLCFLMLGSLSTASLKTWIRLSLTIGLIIFLLFVVWLSIEFYQDRKIDRHYATIRKKRFPLGDGKYECQACGNRQVRIKDKICGICGTVFVRDAKER